MDSVAFKQMKDGTKEDCELWRWDQASFDPDYPSLPLEFFAPIVRGVFGRKACDPKVIRPGAREPLTDATVAAQRAEVIQGHLQ